VRVLLNVQGTAKAAFGVVARIVSILDDVILSSGERVVVQRLRVRLRSQEFETGTIPLSSSIKIIEYNIFVIYVEIDRAEFLRGAVELCKRPRLKARIDWFAFQGQHTESAFMYPAERLLADKSLKSFNSESKLAECQRALG
jgi:hypothetical protein